MSAPTLATTAPTRSLLGLRLALAVGATLLVAALAVVIATVAFAPPPPPAPVPFGLGIREAAPRTEGIMGTIVAFQAVFYDGLRGAVSALKESGAALPTLVGLGFAYGIFHAAGPGHGKAVIAAYLVADGRAAWKGFGLAAAAAALQAVVAVSLVAGAALVVGATARQMDAATRTIEIASFAAVAAMGAFVVWRKAGGLARLVAFARGAPLPPDDEACVHLPDPSALSRLGSLREHAGVVVAAGLRPCAGAIVVLVFALSQGLLWAGVAATLAMAVGTALTTGIIATIAVVAKRLALRLAGGRGLAGTIAVAGLELLAGAFVFVVGVALVAGFVQSGAL